MQIILLEKIEKLGGIGSLVTVKDGYARNFLLPFKKALRATAENKAFFEAQKAELIAKNEALRATAEADSKKIEGAKILIIRQAGDTGHLYGSVSGLNVADALKEKGLKLVSSQIRIDKPIKDVGVYEVKVFLHPEVMRVVKLVVARSSEDADNIEKAIAIAAEKAAAEAASKKSKDAAAAVIAEAEKAAATTEVEAAPVAEKPTKKAAKAETADEKPAKKTTKKAAK